MMLDRIKAALKAAFLPVVLEVEDESYQHHRGEETHYKVVVVSELFEGMSAVKRHQRVYQSLGDLMGQFHALALHTYTVAEWEAKGDCLVSESPKCLGGSLHDKF